MLPVSFTLSSGISHLVGEKVWKCILYRQTTNYFNKSLPNSYGQALKMVHCEKCTEIFTIPFLSFLSVPAIDRICGYACCVCLSRETFNKYVVHRDRTVREVTTKGKFKLFFQFILSEVHI